MNVDYLTLKQFRERNKFIGESNLRELLKKRHSNGLDKAVKKLGKKYLINEKEFFIWMETHLK